MKKYKQLCILALGIVSLVLFLIYKHEYDRLRYVIENLEVFGNPPPDQLQHPPGSAPAYVGQKGNPLNAESNAGILPPPLQQNQNPMAVALAHDDDLPELNLIQKPANSRENEVLKDKKS